MEIATFYRFTFSFRNKSVKEISANQYVETYHHLVILESTNPRFQKDDQIEKLCISVKLDFNEEESSSDGDY